ncbi:hypothetical protein L218DRAFT_1000680 [Marasmius fiardii PR-910]|nr:hypothetical protein L218DRAFT_1000680 [Marasmius fiardii PR-910]
MPCTENYRNFPVDLPIVESMNVRNFEAMDDYPHVISTAKLHSLTLCDPFRYTYPQLDTSSLVHLLVNGSIQHSHLSDIIQRSPNLATLELVGFYGFDQDWTPVIPTRLTTLTIIGPGPSARWNNVGPLLRSMSVPGLKILTICPRLSSPSLSITFDAAATFRLKSSQLQTSVKGEHMKLWSYSEGFQKFEDRPSDR